MGDSESEEELEIEDGEEQNPRGRAKPRGRPKPRKPMAKSAPKDDEEIEGEGADGEDILGKYISPKGKGQRGAIHDAIQIYATDQLLARLTQFKVETVQLIQEFGNFDEYFAGRLYNPLLLQWGIMNQVVRFRGGTDANVDSFYMEFYEQTNKIRKHANKVKRVLNEITNPRRPLRDKLEKLIRYINDPKIMDDPEIKEIAETVQKLWQKRIEKQKAAPSKAPVIDNLRISFEQWTKIIETGSLPFQNQGAETLKKTLKAPGKPPNLQDLMRQVILDRQELTAAQQQEIEDLALQGQEIPHQEMNMHLLGDPKDPLEKLIDSNPELAALATPNPLYEYTLVKELKLTNSILEMAWCVEKGRKFTDQYRPYELPFSDAARIGRNFHSVLNRILGVGRQIEILFTEKFGKVLINHSELRDDYQKVEYYCLTILRNLIVKDAMITLKPDEFIFAYRSIQSRLHLIAGDADALMNRLLTQITPEPGTQTMFKAAKAIVNNLMKPRAKRVKGGETDFDFIFGGPRK